MLQIQRKNQNWLPSIFDDFFFNDDIQSHFNFSERPSMNVSENEKQFKVEVTAPGYAKEDSSVSVNGDEIQISLSHKEEKENKDKYLRREFVQRSFKQSFILPENVDKEKISASLENGILKIVLPKMEPKPEVNQVKQITIC